MAPSWPHLGAIFGPSWAILGHLGPYWAHLGPILGLSWLVNLKNSYRAETARLSLSLWLWPYSCRYGYGCALALSLSLSLSLSPHSLFTLYTHMYTPVCRQTFAYMSIHLLYISISLYIYVCEGVADAKLKLCFYSRCQVEFMFLLKMPS